VKRTLAILLAAPWMTIAANYTAGRATVDGVEVIRLLDAARDIEVLIAPSMGNNAYSMKVNGQQVLWSPYKTLAEWRAKPTLLGVPFLAPWANRIQGLAWWANGKRHTLNVELGNIRRDGNGNPIHGLLTYAPEWQVTALEADELSARVTSRLEYWRYPERMAQFPFAHNLEMTYRLAGGALEVETRIENLARDPMPVAIGYHPYYQLTDAPRDDWKVHLAASDHVVLTRELVPSGEVKPLAFPDPVRLKETPLDDVFTGLVRGADGRAVFWVEGVKQKLAVEYGPNYPVSVVYAPPRRGFICFEPMAGVTNVFNLAHEGKFPLQTAAPGATWKESFWIRPSGF
jgi:aldose 1-epimerase